MERGGNADGQRSRLSLAKLEILCAKAIAKANSQALQQELSQVQSQVQQQSQELASVQGLWTRMQLRSEQEIAGVEKPRRHIDRGDFDAYADKFRSGSA